MLSLLDTLEMPAVVPLEEAASFSRFELDALIRQGLGHRASTCPRVHNILSRIVDLRGDCVAWVFGMPLASLTARRARHLAAQREFSIVPLTIFKTRAGQWIPKIVIYPMDEFDVDRAALIRCHASCRTSGIECMCLTQRHLLGDFIEAKEFKLAFNGAFFSDPDLNASLFCPTLHDWGITDWPKGPRAATFYR